MILARFMKQVKPPFIIRPWQLWHSIHKSKIQKQARGRKVDKSKLTIVYRQHIWVVQDVACHLSYICPCGVLNNLHNMDDNGVYYYRTVNRWMTSSIFFFTENTMHSGCQGQVSRAWYCLLRSSCQLAPLPLYSYCWIRNSSRPWNSFTISSFLTICVRRLMVMRNCWPFRKRKMAMTLMKGSIHHPHHLQQLHLHLQLQKCWLWKFGIILTNTMDFLLSATCASYLLPCSIPQPFCH